MALFLLHVKTFGRAKGGRVTRAAAYRAGERIRDERTGEVYNFADRQDVAHKEILLPTQYANSPDIDWARDRAELWNAAELSGSRRNARLAREVLVILPPELAADQRTQAVRRFSQELADKYHAAVDLTVHRPRPEADPRHHHAHLLMTAREVTPDGLGERTVLELSGTERHARGLGPSKAELVETRERWAQILNDAFMQAGLSVRVDHRGLKALGVNREPVPEIPQSVFYMERRGMTTQAGNDIRTRHLERVAARLKGPDELARVLEKQKQEGRQRALERSKERDKSPRKRSWSSLTREELNQRRRELYQANKTAVSQRRREQRLQNRQGTTRGRESVQERARRGSNEKESVRRWLKMREPQPTAEESVRKWLALREASRDVTPPGMIPEDHSRERTRGSSTTEDEDESHRKNNDRSRDNDYGL